jgi:hypothetical protein
MRKLFLKFDRRKDPLGVSLSFHTGCGGGSINSGEAITPQEKGAEEMRGTNVHTFVPRNAWYKCVAIDTSVKHGAVTLRIDRLQVLRRRTAPPARS